MQDLLHRLISVIFFAILAGVIFTTKFKDFYSLKFFILNFYVRQMGR